MRDNFVCIDSEICTNSHDRKNCIHHGCGYCDNVRNTHDECDDCSHNSVN